LYPEIIAYHLDKEGALRNIEAAYKDVITQIRTSIAEQMKEKAVTSEIEDTLKRQKKLYSNLRNELVKQAGETVADTIIDRVVEGIKNGNLKETLEKLINEFDKIDWFRMSKIPFTDKNSLFNANLLGLITKIETIGKESSQALKDIDSAFDPLIKKPIALLTEIEKLELQLKELLAAFEGAETKNEKEAIREDIKLLKEKIALIKEAKEGEEENTLDYTLDGDGKGKDKWAELLEKVRKYQERRRIALLEGFEKERAQIVSQYDELIKEAETFGIKGKKLAKKLEEEKGEDVIAAAKKYLEKYAEITQKFQDEVLKLAEKTSIKKEESALLKEWLGTDREWREKINSIAVHIEELEEMFEKSTSQAEMHAVVDQLDALYDARLEAVKEHEAAKANVIKKYLHDNNKLVKEREEELTGYYKTERQKRTDEINRQYNERITAEKKTLEGLRSLQKEGNKTISEQNIKELEELIDKLEALRDKEIKVLIRTEGNWLEQLLDIDWANFGDNWEKNLEIMANAAQTMADSMFDLWDNINKISINNMQKELNAFKKAKDEELEVVRKISDEKKNKLSDQLDKGIISQEYYNAQLTKLEQERADKEAEIAAEKEAKELALKKEQFRIDKQAAITKAIISGIVAIMQCYAQSGPIIGSILAALQIGLTAAQVAAISSQPEPYYKGGYIDDEKIIRAGERGREWVASNSLLQDPNTAPFIEALEKYQRGNKNPWNNLVFTTPNASDVSQAASSISHNFAHNKYYSNTNNYVTANNKTSNDKMTDMLDKLYNFLENNKVIGAVLSRKLQEEVNEQETYLRKLATL
ncbi:MAG: hypothetical protein FWC41_01895, partial [Firmicutes bacterium]|nr:hypothetical protein [Bacillota bacterium]